MKKLCLFETKKKHWPFVYRNINPRCRKSRNYFQTLSATKNGKKTYVNGQNRQKYPKWPVISHFHSYFSPISSTCGGL